MILLAGVTTVPLNGEYVTLPYADLIKPTPFPYELGEGFIVLVVNAVPPNPVPSHVYKLTFPFD